MLNSRSSILDPCHKSLEEGGNHDDPFSPLMVKILKTNRHTVSLLCCKMDHCNNYTDHDVNSQFSSSFELF